MWHLARTFNEELGIRDFVIKALNDDTVMYMAKERSKQPSFIRYLYECSDLTKKEIAYILSVRNDRIERMSKTEGWKKFPKVQKFSINKIQDAVIQGTFGLVPVKFETEEELRKRSSHIFRVISLMLENNIKTDNMDKSVASACYAYLDTYKKAYEAQLEVYGYVDTNSKLELEYKYKQLELKAKELEKENRRLVIENVQKFETALGLTGGEIVNMLMRVTTNLLDDDTSFKLVEAFKETYQKLVKVKNYNDPLPLVEMDDKGRVVSIDGVVPEETDKKKISNKKGVIRRERLQKKHIDD